MATEPTIALDTPLPRRSLPARRARVGEFRWQTALIILLLCLWESFPFGPMGINPLLPYQGYAAFVFLGVPLYFIRVGTGKITASYWEVLAIALFGLCVLSSAIYSGIIDPIPLREWLPAIYTVAPVLTILLLKAVDANLRDAERALYIAGVAGSLLVIINGALDLHLLDFYVRGSGFGTKERVVFFKIEATFALVIAFVRLAYARSFGRVVLSALAVGITFYNVFVLSESRLAIVAIFIALFLVWLFVMRGGRKLFFLLFGPFIALPVISYVIERYMRSTTDLGSYFRNDVSASFRATEIRHFAEYFDDTYGLGFGFMSGNPEYNNIIAYSSNRGGYLYGTGDYGLGLDDIGLYSALYQYGWAGLILIVIMTLLISVVLLRSARFGMNYAVTGAIGAMMLAFMFSPISMNFFTLFYTAHIGGLLLFMASAAPAGKLAPRRRRTGRA